MILDDVHRGIQPHRKRKRVGRGTGSGHGKTCGRGHKGYYSRAGASRRLSYEGGQMPLARRIAKRGFNNKKFATPVAIINLGTLERAFEDGAEVSVKTLRDRGLIPNNPRVLVKVLGNGKLSKRLTVHSHRFSKSATEKIVACGGECKEVA